MSKEIVDYRIQNGKEPLWTNSMFSGMPAYQTSVIHHNNYLIKVDGLLKLDFALPRPVGLMFLAMLGFYIFTLCLRVNPWLGIVGALAFGFSTINLTGNIDVNQPTVCDKSILSIISLPCPSQLKVRL
jgi:hypothetical protein